MRPSKSPFDRLRERREQRMNFHGLAGARKEIYSKFTQNLLEKFTPNLLSPALAELDFQSPLDCAFF